MIELIDLFFEPIVNLLLNVRGSLAQTIIVAKQGLNINYYIGYIAPLGPVWVALITRLFFCSFIVVIILVAKTGWGLYLKIKESIKWW